MRREELIKSREYWIADIQLRLFNVIDKYMADNKLNKTQLAEKLGVTKGYVSQILNGDFDHKISKLVDLTLACDQLPILEFKNAEEYLGDEICGLKEMKYANFTMVSSSEPGEKIGGPSRHFEAPFVNLSSAISKADDRS